MYVQFVRNFVGHEQTLNAAARRDVLTILMSDCAGIKSFHIVGSNESQTTNRKPQSAKHKTNIKNFKNARILFSLNLLYTQQSSENLEALKCSTPPRGAQDVYPNK